MMKNKIYVEIQNGKKIIKTWVDGEEGFKKLFDSVKNVMFGKESNERKPAGFIQNNKKEEDNK